MRIVYTYYILSHNIYILCAATSYIYIYTQTLYTNIIIITIIIYCCIYVYIFIYVYEYNESDSLRGQRATFPFTDGARKIISSYRISARCVGPTRWVSCVVAYYMLYCVWVINSGTMGKQQVGKNKNKCCRRVCEYTVVGKGGWAYTKICLIIRKYDRYVYLLFIIHTYVFAMYIHTFYVFTILTHI